MINPYFNIAVLLALIGSSLAGYSAGYGAAADEYNDANRRLAEKTREAILPARKPPSPISAI